MAHFQCEVPLELIHEPHTDKQLALGPSLLGTSSWYLLARALLSLS